MLLVFRVDDAKIDLDVVMLQTVQTHVASVYFESCIFH
jgi:hypothetical protein